MMKTPLPKKLAWRSMHLPLRTHHTADIYTASPHASTSDNSRVVGTRSTRMHESVFLDELTVTRRRDNAIHSGMISILTFLTFRTNCMSTYLRTSCFTCPMQAPSRKRFVLVEDSDDEAEDVTVIEHDQKSTISGSSGRCLFVSLDIYKPHSLNRSRRCVLQTAKNTGYIPCWNVYFKLYYNTHYKIDLPLIHECKFNHLDRTEEIFIKIFCV